jgi:peptide/nickel transport system permease protein
VAAGLACALLVRYSPGALVDERELDPRLKGDSIAALRAGRAADLSLGGALLQYLKHAARGDLGFSTSNNAPIVDLLKQSAPVTFREVGVGLAGAWLLGLGAGIGVARFRRNAFVDLSSGGLAAVLLSLPAALVAYFCLSAGAAATTVLVLVLAPRVFRFSRNLLIQAYESPHVDMARARGVGEWRILAAHVLPSAAPQLFALVAASLSMAVGAAIPIEAICDTAGLGRLAWHAAMSRDLLLLVNLTMLIALATTVAAGLADLATSRGGAETC